MSGFTRRSTAEEVSEGVDLSGRHAIVTGANTGIGFETARVLSLRGCSVTMACRSLEKARAARDQVLAGGGGVERAQLDVQALDLGALQSVRDFARGFLASDRRLDLLVNNAGVMLPDRRETSDGFEAHLGVNHLGHFLLTQLLLDRLRESAPARVVNVSSDLMHFSSLDEALHDLNWEKRRFSGMRSYGDSKLMNLLFSSELTRRVEGSGVVSHALHPGVVRTELARDQPWWMGLVGLLMLPVMKSPERGAATTVFVATSPECGEQGGGYFSDCAPARTPKLAGNREVELQLWERSAELVAP